MILVGDTTWTGWTNVSGSFRRTSYDANRVYGYGMNASSAALNNEVKRSFKVGTDGQYACKVSYVQAPQSAIYTIKLNGTIVGSFDGYAPTDVTLYDGFVSPEIPLGALTADSAYWLHVAALSKNAESSGYYLDFSRVVIYRVS